MKILVATDTAQPTERYVAALVRAGARPEEVFVVRPGDVPPADFDGLLVTGGADVHPSRYGETGAGFEIETDEARDALDFALLARADEERVPVFGICRGLQVMNVERGGTLWQDLPGQRERGVKHDFWKGEGNHPGHLAHGVRPRAANGPATSPLALLLSGADLAVNSRHHQAVKDLAPSLVPLAASPDDLVEAFERLEEPFFAAVQWHPEDLVHDPVHLRLFTLFLAAARERAGRSTPAAASGRLNPDPSAGQEIP